MSIKTARAIAITPFDASGIDAFLIVAKKLVVDAHVTLEQWQLLEQTPGYRALLESEFPPQFFRKALPLACSPARKSDLRNSLEENSLGYEGRYARLNRKAKVLLEHYRRACGDLRRVAKLRDRLQNTNVLQQAITIAKHYLPPMKTSSIPAPALVIFAPDARGYTPVVLDIFFAAEMNKRALTELLGHEFHHFFRNKLKQYHVPKCLAESDRRVLWALDQMQAEGIGDFIFSASLLRELVRRESGTPPTQIYPEPMIKGAVQYRIWMKESPKRLETFQRLVEKVADKQIVSNLRTRIGEALPRSCHPNGFYMADRILRRLGKQRLIRRVADPFSFVRDYQEAAHGNGGNNGFVFSKVFMRYLESLETKVRSGNCVQGQ